MSPERNAISEALVTIQSLVSLSSNELNTVATFLGNDAAIAGEANVKRLVDPDFRVRVADGVTRYHELLSAWRMILDRWRTARPELVRQVMAGMAASESDPIQRVEFICERFHAVARQLRQRHDNRDTLNVSDEYDVQDLIHALLLLDFDDIRPEEWTPSYAGACSRMDFVLKREQIVLEIKKTRTGLTARKLGEELLVDCQRYKAHPDCKMLVCFVYDPEGLIGNPRGLEDDLTTAGGDMPVRVYIRP